MYLKPHTRASILRCWLRPKTIKDLVPRIVTQVVILFAVGNIAAPNCNADGINQWLNDLRSTDVKIRIRAAYAYERLEPVNKVTVLRVIDGLKDNNVYVRRYCASALGEIGVEPGLVVPALIQALADSDVGVKEHAAIALSKIGAPAVTLLVEVLRSTTELPRSSAKPTDEEKREPVTSGDYAAFALSEIGPSAVSQLMIASARSDENLRNKADQILSRIGKVLESDLHHFLNDADPNVRLWAAITLAADWRFGFHEADRSMESNVRTDRMTRILEAAIQQKQKPSRLKAIRALGNMRREALTARSSLIRLLNDQDDDLRSAAAASLGEIGIYTREAAPELIPLTKDPSPKVRISAISALGNSYDARETVENALIGSLSDPDLEVRDSAISALSGLAPKAERTLPALVDVIVSWKREKTGPLFSSRIQLLLKRIGASDIKPILELLKHKDDRVRIHVLEALEELESKNPSVSSTVVSLLTDQNKTVRMKSAELLIRSHEGQAVATLVELLNDPDESVRIEAAWMFRGDRRAARAAVPALLRAMHDRSLEVRYHALSALVSIKDRTPVFVDSLIAALSDGDHNMRSQAASALEAFDEEDKERIARKAVPLLVKSIVAGSSVSSEENSYYSTYRLLTALRSFGTESVPAFREMIQSDNVDVSRRAAEIGGDIVSRDGKAFAFINRLLTDSRTHVRLNGVELLVRAKPVPSSLIATLIKMLGDPNVDIRLTALTMLRRLGPRAKRARPAIQNLRGDQDIRVRVAAIDTMLAIDLKTASAVRALIEELTHEDSRGLEHPAIASLAEIGAPAIPRLITLLGHPHVTVRQKAIIVFKELGSSVNQALPALIRSLQDSDAQVRLKAAQLIGSIGPEAGGAAQQLITLLDDRDETVRFAALDALFAVGFDFDKVGLSFNTVLNDGLVSDLLPIRMTAIKELEGGRFRYIRMLNEAFFEPYQRANRARYGMLPRRLPLPQLPWPPPRFSDLYVVPRNSLGTDKNTLASVEHRLTTALRDAGYDSHTFYAAPGGFAIVTRLERIFDDGTSYPIPLRWTREKIAPATIKGYLSALFFESPGQFRMFIFVISNIGSIPSNSGTLTEAGADEFLAKGGGILADDVGRLQFRGRNCQVLVYRFQKKFPKGASMEYNDPLGLSAEKHVRNSGLAKFLGF